MRTRDYTYDLPPERIALHPLQARDMSKLLVYRAGAISHDTFAALPERLPENAFLFFNDTRVIPARLHFQKDSGATIEIFLLAPVTPSPLVADAMVATNTCTWTCTIGNLRRWTSGLLLRKHAAGVTLTAELADRATGRVVFRWDGDDSFASVIEKLGDTPLPPYIRRQARAVDRERYQTVYSHHDGAVAAPTAGLHFTPAVLERLQEKSIGRDFLTLHVSAGTFQPIKTDNPREHTMHEEQVVVTRKNIANLLEHHGSVIAVGTTSMRTLESLYWYGARLTRDPDTLFRVGQEEPYESTTTPPAREALEAVANYMDRSRTETLIGETSIFIRPGYIFRLCDGLITNFHQPGSTLILLVAAFVGDDWRKIYQAALTHDYRFLSYGDSSLLLPRR